MPAERSTKKKAGRLSNNVEPCIICGKVVSRGSDIPRHMQKHNSDAKKLPCPWEGCPFSTLQKSNLDTHYRRHTQDRSFLCLDDPVCNFQTCDPASLLRHRKRLHNYVPKPSIRRKINKPDKAPGCRGRKASVASSSVGSPLSVESSFGSNSPASTSPSSSTSPPSPSGESESTTSIPSTPEALSSPFNESDLSMNSSGSSLHPKESLLFSDSQPLCSYSYAWDKSLLPELDFSVAEPETEQFEFEFPYQGQQKESQSQMKDFFPLQLSNMEQIFPGYGTSGQLYGSYGLNFGFEQPSQQVPLPEVNNDTWFDLSVNGSPILQYHNLPAGSFSAPVGIDYSPEMCSPVRTGSFELDMEATSGSGLDVRFDSGVPGEDTDSTRMISPTCDSNSVFFDLTRPSPKLAGLAVCTDATYVQLQQDPSASILTDGNVNFQTYANPNLLSAFGLDYLDHSQLTDDLNGQFNRSPYQADASPNFIDLSASGLDYFDQCRWDFGIKPASGIVEGSPGGVLSCYS